MVGDSSSPDSDWHLTREGAIVTGSEIGTWVAMEVNEAANVLAREVTAAALWGICATSIGAIGGTVTAASVAVKNNTPEPLAPTICGTITGTILGAALALFVIFNKKRKLCSD